MGVSEHGRAHIHLHARRMWPCFVHEVLCETAAATAVGRSAVVQHMQMFRVSARHVFPCVCIVFCGAGGGVGLAMCGHWVRVDW